MTGVVPPVSDTAWQAEFDKYKTIPQFRERNAAMTLAGIQDDLLVGVVAPHAGAADRRGVPAAVPLVSLARLDRARTCGIRLWTIFGLGAALGAVGWWMVSSGLTERVSVSQYRLAFHLTLACVIFAAIVWTAARLGPRAASRGAGTDPAGCDAGWSF